jgi:predicted anti-sigma-YlaC factor YlaD
MDGSPAMKWLAERHAAWAEQLPEQEAALWDWVLAQDAATIAGLMAYCAACTVKPLREACADRLAAAVSLDMAQWWKPSAAYFGRMPKGLILEAVTEGVSKQAAAGRPSRRPTRSTELHETALARRVAVSAKRPFSGRPPCQPTTAMRPSITLRPRACCTVSNSRNSGRWLCASRNIRIAGR